MKRNLLIGTSLVAAAVASTSLDARSFSVMTEEARKDNTELNAAIHVVTVGHAKTTGKTALKSGETSAFAEAYKAAEAYVLAEHTKAAKDGKVAPVTFAEVAKALATDKALLALVKNHRELVVAQVEADAKKAAEAKKATEAKKVIEANKTTEDNKADVKADVQPNLGANTDTTVKNDTTDEAVEVDFETAKSNATTAVKAVITAVTTKLEAEKAVLNKDHTVAARTEAKEKASEALEAAKTDASAKTEAFNTAKTAHDNAETALKDLNKNNVTKSGELTVLTDTLTIKVAQASKDASNLSESDALSSEEKLSLSKLTAEVNLLKTQVLQAEKAVGDAKTKLDAAENAKKTAEENVKTAEKAFKAAERVLTRAGNAKTEAEAELKDAVDAVEKAKTDSEAAIKAELAAAQKAKTDADTKVAEAKAAEKELKARLSELTSEGIAALEAVNKLNNELDELKSNQTNTNGTSKVKVSNPAKENELKQAQIKFAFVDNSVAAVKTDLNTATQQVVDALKAQAEAVKKVTLTNLYKRLSDAKIKKAGITADEDYKIYKARQELVQAGGSAETSEEDSESSTKLAENAPLSDGGTTGRLSTASTGTKRASSYSASRFNSTLEEGESDEGESDEVEALKQALKQQVKKSAAVKKQASDDYTIVSEMYDAAVTKAKQVETASSNLADKYKTSTDIADPFNSMGYVTKAEWEKYKSEVSAKLEK